MHSQKMWNGGEKDNRFNEHTGYPDGRPPERDHAKILQLPIDLEQRSKEVRCAWLKKQFKKLVRQYHPDKVSVLDYACLSCALLKLLFCTDTHNRILSKVQGEQEEGSTQV